MVGVRSRAFLKEAPADPTFKFLSELAKELSSGRVELPSFPDAAVRVQQVLSDPAVDGDRTARVIGADAGLDKRTPQNGKLGLFSQGQTKGASFRA